MYEEFLKVIDERKDDFCAIPDFLWDNSETSFGEYKSAEYITRFLEENGFTVTRNLCNIPTLQATANEAMHDIPVPVSTKEELEFGKAIQATLKLTPEQASKPPYAETVLTPAHTWQAVSQCRSSYAKKAMLYAGKAVASTLMRLADNPELISQAKEEFKEKTGSGYVCGTPDDVYPQIQPKPYNM